MAKPMSNAPSHTCLSSSPLLSALLGGVLAATLLSALPAQAESLRAAGGACSEVFVVVEERPELIGGTDALQARVRYPQSARAAGVEGRVFVQFTVDTRGQVRNPVVTRGVRADLDAEAVRVVKAARFTPGRMRGRAVCVQMALPITFRADAPAVSPPVGAQPSTEVVGEALAPVSDAAASVQSTAASATGTVDDAASTVESSAASATEQVDSVAASVDAAAASISEASSSVTQGVDDTKSSVSDAYSSTAEGVSEAAESVRSTFRGLFGRKKDDEGPPRASAARGTAPASEEAPAAPDATAGQGATAGPGAATFAAGDVLAAKIDNVTLRAEPAADAAAVATLATKDALVYLGDEKNGFLRVQSASGPGWVNKVLVKKQ